MFDIQFLEVEQGKGSKNPKKIWVTVNEGKKYFLGYLFFGESETWQWCMVSSKESECTISSQVVQYIANKLRALDRAAGVPQTPKESAPKEEAKPRLRSFGF